MKIMFFALFLLSVLNAQTIAVEGTGYGLTENEAIQKAKRDALEKGIGQTLVSQTEVENFMVKKDLVLTRTAGNVKSYEVLESAKGLDGAWKVVLKAQVSKDGLRSDLQAMMILVQAIDNPRIALLISEKMSEKELQTKFAEAYLLNFFKERTFDVVDPNQVLRFSESAEGVSALGGDPEAMAKIGSALNAEVLIIADVQYSEADLSENPMFEGSGFRSVSSTVAMKAFNVSTRKILAASNGKSPGAHIHLAVAAQKATEMVLKNMMNEKDQFFDRLVKEWQSKVNDGAVYEVVVRGVKNFAAVKSVKYSLEQVGQKLQQRSFKKPELFLEIQFIGSLEDLCTHLDGLENADGKLSVLEFQGNKVVVELN